MISLPTNDFIPKLISAILSMIFFLEYLSLGITIYRYASALNDLG